MAMKVQLKINHRIITHTDFNDLDDEAVGNKTKEKCINTVINSNKQFLIILQVSQPHPWLMEERQGDITDLR